MKKTFLSTTIVLLIASNSYAEAFIPSHDDVSASDREVRYTVNLDETTAEKKARRASLLRSIESEAKAKQIAYAKAEQKRMQGQAGKALTPNVKNDNTAKVSLTEQATTFAIPEENKDVVEAKKTKLKADAEKLKAQKAEKLKAQEAEKRQMAINANSWSIPKGTTLREGLNDWVKKAGWQYLSWESNKEFPVVVNIHVQGSFQQAVSTVLKAYHRSGNPLYGCLKQGNRVLVVADTPLNDKCYSSNLKISEGNS